jgi:malate dehydrogenase (oxaloacetate-decarboxylating)
LLQEPQYNKGSVFSKDERQEFDLQGRLPTRISSLEEQLERAYDQYSSLGDDLTKNTFMTSKFVRLIDPLLTY